MKARYYPETDSLYVDVHDVASVDSREIARGVVADYDAAGNLVGIDIDNPVDVLSDTTTREAVLRLIDSVRKKSAATG